MRSVVRPEPSLLYLLAERRGVAAAEFALIAPLLISLLLVVYDIGNAVQERLVLEQALRAGGRYAISFPNRPDGIKLAVQQAYPSGWTDVDVEVQSSPPSVGSPYYVTLSASRTSYFSFALPSFLLPPLTVSASYVIRVQ